MLKFTLPAVCLLAGAMLVSNPNQDAHARAIVAHAKGACGPELADRIICTGAAALAAPVVGYDDHLLYSTAQLGQTRTFGALGAVIILPG